jgi:hypothetical protein
MMDDCTDADGDQLPREQWPGGDRCPDCGRIPDGNAQVVGWVGFGIPVICATCEPDPPVIP